MKIYKVKTMGSIEIPIEEEELATLIMAINKGVRCVVMKHGVVFPSSIDSITIHKKIMEDIAERMRFGRKVEEASKDVLGFAPFAELADRLKGEVRGALDS